MANGVGTALYRRENVNFVFCAQGALGAKFGIPRFGKSNEFFKSGDFDQVRRQIFVKIRCDRSQIVHPRTGVMAMHQTSNRAAEWVNRSKCSGKLAPTGGRTAHCRWQQVERSSEQSSLFLKIIFVFKRNVVVVETPPERAVGGDGFAIDRSPKTNKKGRKGTKDDIRTRRAGIGCGSLGEVHLLFRGVLQTRHQVTAARLEIRDPLRCPTPSQGDSHSSSCTRNSCQSDRWRLLP